MLVKIYNRLFYKDRSNVAFHKQHVGGQLNVKSSKRQLSPSAETDKSSTATATAGTGNSMSTDIQSQDGTARGGASGGGDVDDGWQVTTGARKRQAGNSRKMVTPIVIRHRRSISDKEKSPARARATVLSFAGDGGDDDGGGEMDEELQME